MTRILLALFALCLAAPAYAAPSAPACGTTLTVTGDLGPLWRVPAVNCPPDQVLTIDASAARADAGWLTGATGIVIKGGTWGKSGSAAPAFTVDGSHNVRLTGMTFTGSASGVKLLRGTDYTVDYSRFDGLRSDGADIGAAQRVTLDHNVMVNFHPAPGDHPDGIQAFSALGQVPNRDLVFTNNLIVGEAQGIDNFGDAAGTTNVRVEGNVIVSTFWHGITFAGVKGLIMRGNTVLTYPGAMQGAQPIRTWINADRSTDVTACGNVVPAYPSGVGTKAC